MNSLILKLRNDSRIKNSLWMFIEKGISLFGLIFIISAVAKYTGPKIYGEISLAASIFIVLKTIAQLGLDQTFFKYVSENKPYYNLFMSNAIKLTSMIFALVFCLVFVWSLNFSSYTGFWFIIATGVAYYFNSIDLVNFFNEGRLLSRLNVFANIWGLIIALIMRYAIVVLNLNVIYLCIPIIIMTLIPFLIKLYFYKEYLIDSKKYISSKSLKYYKYFLYTGAPLTLSILTVSINTQVANYYLAFFESTKSVAVYSVAFILAGAWCIVPTTLIMSYMPTIYNTKNLKDYIDAASILLKIVVLISIFILFTLYTLSAYVVNILYGVDYLASILVFKILIFMQFFWVVNFYFSRLIVKYNGYRFLAYKNTICCILNALIMSYLVCKHSVIGAAVALLLTEFISLVMNLAFKKANIFKILYQSLFFRVKEFKDD